jgi:hypothetical protein
MKNLFTDTKNYLNTLAGFASKDHGFTFRHYQLQVAQDIVDSVTAKRGLTFVVIFPRQSGKNEIQAQVEAYLLSLFATLPAEIVKCSPTSKPQSLTSMRRLERILRKSSIAHYLYQKEEGYIFRVGDARIFFLSGDPTSNIVGATASTLLEVDEAQDVLTSKYDKDIAPMAASTNATRVFWGTAWTSRTLLARELRAARNAELKDGIRRVFHITADDVRKEVPAYGLFVDEQVAKLGRNHPMVRTQFFSEEIDSEGGMFNIARLNMMKGSHAPLAAPQPGCLYAFTLDVAGEDEGITGEVGELSAMYSLHNTGRDSTALTIFEIDLSTLQDEIIRAPRYLVVGRKLWTGVKHSSIYGELRGLIDQWQPRYIVADNTGVGAGLVSFLTNAYREKMIPFTFTSKSKSDLGWSFIAVIESGRYKEPAVPLPLQGRGEGLGNVWSEFFRQCEAAQSEILEGPGKLMRWSVPDGMRDERTGELMHDDLLVSAALCSQLDLLPWGTAESEVIQATDPLAAMKEAY